MNDVETLRALSDRQQITDLIHRYCRPRPCAHAARISSCR